MKICHLHIGMHKTGSSSIQNYLNINRAELIQSGFCYADMGSANHSGPLLYSLCFEPALDSEIKHIKITPEELERRIEFYKSKLCQALEGDYSNIIFSAEAIVKLTKDELFSFREYLLRYVDEVKVYCYVREPMPFTVSSFQQVIKTIPVFLDNQHLLPNYEEKLQKFEDVFQCVEYRVFSRNTLLDGDVTSDFCSWLGIPYLGGEEANNSLGALAVKFLYRFQHARKEISICQKSLELIEKTLERLPYQKIILPTKEMSDIIENNHSDFLWMKSILKEKNPHINFDINDTQPLSYGNFLGVFTESEKTELVDLAKSSVEFNDYIRAETMLDVTDLVNLPLLNFDNLELYLRKVDDSSFGGWARYINDENKKVEIDVYLNNKCLDKVIADIHRSDISVNEGNVGYFYKFNSLPNEMDLISLLVEGDVVYSGFLFS